MIPPEMDLFEAAPFDKVHLLGRSKKPGTAKEQS